MVSHLEYCVQFWSPKHKGGKDIPERVHRKATRVMKQFSCEERLRELGVCSLNHLRGTCQYIELPTERVQRGQSQTGKRTRGNQHKLKHRRFNLNIRKRIFIVRVTENKLHREFVISFPRDIRGPGQLSVGSPS